VGKIAMSWAKLRERMAQASKDGAPEIRAVWKSGWALSDAHGRQPHCLRARAVIGHSAEGYHAALEYGGYPARAGAWSPAMNKLR
jgi:hypothetical protein